MERSSDQHPEGHLGDRGGRPEPGVGDQQPLALVFKCLAFAKQRFDSSAGPVAEMALMLVPIAVLLAYIGSDMRHTKEKRDRALALLKRLWGN